MRGLLSMSLSAKGDKNDGLSSCELHTFGGQAVIEGVMMRGRNSWGLAVRRPSGGIARMSYPLDPPGSRNKLLRLPVVRGVVALYDSLSLGIKALGISANIGMEDPEAEGTEGAVGAPSDGETPEVAVAQSSEGGKKEKKSDAFGFAELAISVILALGMAVGLFVVIPLFVVKYFEDVFANPFVFNLVEGIIRIVIFLLYVLIISFIPDLRRVFQYHGAEHKVIHAYEASGRVDTEEAKGKTTLHPRCGTGFLLLVMVIAVFLFAIVGKPSLLWLVVSRIIGIPVIIGISYEVGIKWAGGHPDGLFARTLLWPGLQLQRLTTREPTEDQLEVAAAALEAVMAMDASQQETVEEQVPATA